MEVLLINGSPRKNGCTFTALSEVAKGLEKGGVQSAIFQLGTAPVHGCVACGACHRAGLGQCVFNDDIANKLLEEMKRADGIIIGSPVYYAGPNGALCAVLDRCFYAAGPQMAGKPGAAVVSCRRGGATAALDRLNKYFGINDMPVAGSQYWNMVHGNSPEEVAQDKEGLQIMRRLGEHTAWLLQNAQNGRPLPPREDRQATNFIR